MSVSAAVQKAIYGALTGHSGVSALVGDRVFGRVPVGADFPYISLGSDDFDEDDADCIEAETGTIQVDVWSRVVGKVEAKRITGAVKAALHDADLALDEPYALADCRVRSISHRLDPDGLTTHGIVQVQITVEKVDG